MTLYTFREVILKNESYERKRLVIDFSKKDMAIVGEFLMSDAHLVNGKVLKEINDVIAGKKETILSSGNRCAWEIHADTTIISDLFVDMDGVQSYAAYEIETPELKRLIEIWLKKVAEFGKENE